MANSDKKHQKHTNLARPDFGYFHRNEWAILGTPCGNIQRLAYAIVDRLSEIYNVGYDDADHAHGDEAPEWEGAMEHGAKLSYTDKIHFHRFDRQGEPGTHQFRWHFNDQDAVIVNGNHFPAKRQIVVIDPKKEDSLRRKLDRLTDVRLVLLADGVKEPYPWLRDALEGFSNIPQMKLEDYAGIPLFVEKELNASAPPLYGLVLAGGKSERMGEDKGLIDYHGQPQRDHVTDLIGHYCKETYLSCRPDQTETLNNPIADTFTGLGPFGGILSAFRQNPDAAWLVVACDLPLLDDATLSQLVGYRNASKAATAFNSPTTEFPEPLITIWEPRAYPILLQFLAQGYSCPRKVLINADIELLDAENPKALRNVNSPEEKEEIINIIKEKTQ
jgi:molybdopterin-guanine dinucleotide biosynthesis protein A